MARRLKESRPRSPRRRVVELRVRGRVYQADLTPDRKAGGYTVRVPALPGCLTEGDTLVEAKRMVREAIALWLDVGPVTQARTRSTNRPPREPPA
jgi:predicted RNase H-like HicB family nuclease